MTTSQSDLESREAAHEADAAWIDERLRLGLIDDAEANVLWHLSLNYYINEAYNA